MDYHAKIRELLEEAAHARRSRTAVPILEEAVRLADAHQDLDLGMQTRELLVDAAYFGGAPERAITAFSWMIAQLDANPERFDERDILWKYKWIAEHFPFMHQIDRATIERTLDDMQQRYERNGYDRRPVTNLRAWNAMWQGDTERAQALRRQWWERPRDSMADCWACEVNYNVQYHVEEGQTSRAVELAERLLSRDLGCAEIPHITFGYILWPLLQLGRPGEALEIHRAGYELARHSPDFLMEVGEHVAFASHTGAIEQATHMLERHLTWALDTAAQLKAGHLLAAGEGLMAALDAAGNETLPIRLPREVRDELGERPSTAELRDWLAKRRTEIGEAFDARNGSTFVSERLELVRARAARED